MEQPLETTRIKELLLSNKKRLDSITLEFLPLKHNSPEINALYDMMRDYPGRGGKGLRGSLCLLWCRLFGGNEENAMITAAALELFQNWILIHDDIEDQSDLRRGLPALHKKVGIEQAINAGDALHGKMWELLLKNRAKLGPDLTLQVMNEFTKMLNATTEGQQMELNWTITNNWNISERDYYDMVVHKSAWYTCITPARLGIEIASRSQPRLQSSAKNDLLEKVVQFGTKLGTSFQIIDDVLNLMADESKYGKEIMGDLFEGKRTLMIIHLLEHSPESQRRKIIDILSKLRMNKRSDEVRFDFDALRDAGSIEYAKAIAGRLSREALSMFDEMITGYGVSKGETYTITRTLLEYLTTREY